MPKPPRRLNPRRPENRPPIGRSRQAPKQINQLLSGNKLLSTAVQQQANLRDRLEGFFTERLDPALGRAIGHYSEKDGQLTVFVRSAAWSARLRFALAELWPELQRQWPQLNNFAVKIQPAAASEVDART